MKFFVSALMISASMFGVAAHAAGNGELDYPPAIAQTSHLTRAQVFAELQSAKAAGEVTNDEEEAPVMQASDSTLTRAAVKTELARAEAAGEIQNGEATFLPSDANMAG